MNIFSHKLRRFMFLFVAVITAFGLIYFFYLYSQRGRASGTSFVVLFDQTNIEVSPNDSISVQIFADVATSNPASIATGNISFPDSLLSFSSVNAGECSSSNDEQVTLPGLKNTVQGVLRNSNEVVFTRNTLVPNESLPSGRICIAEVIFTVKSTAQGTGYIDLANQIEWVATGPQGSFAPTFNSGLNRITVTVSNSSPSPSVKPTISPPEGSETVDLYGVYELLLNHDASLYTNPFEYSEITLNATIVSPSGQSTPFWGFYNWNDEWGIRWMPNETGNWTVNWSFSDNSASGTAVFNVIDTGKYGGPLLADGWYTKDSRGRAVDLKGYGMIITEFDTTTYESRYDYLIDQIPFLKEHDITIILEGGNGPPPDVIDYDGDYWRSVDRFMEAFQDAEIYYTMFRYMNQQTVQTMQDSILENFQRWRIARYGAYSIDVGVNPTWEWSEVVDSSRISYIQSSYANLDPFPRLLTAHDSSVDEFSSWIGYSSRQAGLRNITENHSRTAGQHGGVSASLSNRPIFGMEDLWYLSPYGQAQTISEIRQGMWNSLLTGIVPFLTTKHWELQMETPPEMLEQYDFATDFVFNHPDYRNWKQVSSLETSRQIVSGSPSSYIVYKTSGDVTLTNEQFNLTWLNPVTGEKIVQSNVSGPTLISPFGTGESALIAEKVTGGTTPTPTPTKTPTPLPSATPTGQITPSPGFTISPTSPPVVCPRKSEGDANCDDRITLLDFDRWRQEFLKILGTRTADFDSSQSVSLVDFEIWRSHRE